MFGFRVPIFSIVIGEGGSGGALAIGCSNRSVAPNTCNTSVFAVCFTKRSSNKDAQTLAWWCMLAWQLWPGLGWWGSQHQDLSHAQRMRECNIPAQCGSCKRRRHGRHFKIALLAQVAHPGARRVLRGQSRGVRSDFVEVARQGSHGAMHKTLPSLMRLSSTIILCSGFTRCRHAVAQPEARKGQGLSQAAGFQSHRLLVDADTLHV